VLLHLLLAYAHTFVHALVHVINVNPHLPPPCGLGVMCE
jgi:hypothetical protein